MLVRRRLTGRKRVRVVAVAIVVLVVVILALTTYSTIANSGQPFVLRETSTGGDRTPGGGGDRPIPTKKVVGGPSDPPKPDSPPPAVSASPFYTGAARTSLTASFNEKLTDANGEDVVITHAITPEGVEALYPLIVARDALSAPAGHRPENWRSRFMPVERFEMPLWATARERNTLNHASIFISIAAFRDHECATTLESALRWAASPHRIYAGISEERRPTDSSCLAALQLQNGDTSTARSLLYGPTAPAAIVVKTRELTWADILRDPVTGRPNNVSMEATAKRFTVAGSVVANGPIPPGTYMEDAFMAADRITCIYSDLEAERDRLTLAAGEEDRGARARRGRRGGPQESPSAALAGCRVTTRVTPEVSARGPTFGRYVTSLLLFHQDYFMVVDSHSRFPTDWDLKMISRVFQMTSRGVLSHYPNGYTPAEPVKEYNNDQTMAMCKSVVLANGMPKLGARWIKALRAPVRATMAAAGYMFSDAQSALDVPFDPFLPYLFDGEEVLYSARLWTSGWDLYAPALPMIYHHYLRHDTPKFWDLVKQKESALRVSSEQRALYLLRRTHPWAKAVEDMGRNVSDMDSIPHVEPERRLIITDAQADANGRLGVDKTYYGVGAVRTLGEYWTFAGVDDFQIRARDKENRWAGSEKLCEALGKIAD